jgi:hypothetical protein
MAMLATAAGRNLRRRAMMVASVSRAVRAFVVQLCHPDSRVLLIYIP